MNHTLDYYNKNAQQFSKETISVDFTKTQDRFLNYLTDKGYILDFGCGSGRDTKYFLDKGFQVKAVDGSKELCRLAAEYTGIKVGQMLFEDLDEKEIYDGIWACSSILHLAYGELEDVFIKMARALTSHGILYTSFKYGTAEGERNGRYFTDMTEENFRKFIQNIDSVKIEEYWITGDVRQGRGEEKWLNLILRKN